MRLVRLLPLALVAALMAIAALPAAAADDGSDVQVVEAGTALFPDRAYVLTFAEPRGSALTTEDVTVTEDGKPVSNLSVLSAASAEGIGTVLMIDSSNSMKDSIDDAMQAARTFAARNPGQPLSVVYFNRKPTIALPLTTDRAKVTAVLAKPPKLAEGTRMFDALAAAVAQVRGSALGAARIVLLSDGDDVGSRTSLDAALGQLNAQRIRVFTVGIQSSDFTSTDLEALADKTGGTYGEASSSEALTKIYDELGFQLGNEYLLRYRSAARPDVDVNVEVAVVGVEPVAFTYTTPSTGTAAPFKPAFRDELLQSPLLIPLVVALVLVLGFFTIRALLSLRSNKELVSRLGDFVTLPVEERAAERRKEVDELLAVVGAQKQQRRNWRWMDGFAEDVDVAQIRFDATRMVWASVLVGLLLGVVVGALVHPIWFLTALAPPVALNLWVRNRARKVRKTFAEQLPENLDVLASALRAGHSLAGAMGVVADEAPEPSKREYTRVATDEALGIPLDEALEVTAKRMQNQDLDQVAVLALVQREAGGNTAEVLDQVIANIRARMDRPPSRRRADGPGQVLELDHRRRSRRDLHLPHLRQPRPPGSPLQRPARAGRLDLGDRDGALGLLHHPTHRLDRALTMIHFILIIGLVLLAVAVVMVARAVATPGKGSETIQQIGAYGFAGTLPQSDTEHGPGVRARLDTVTGALGRSLLRRFERLRGNDYRARLIAAGMYTTTPERLLGLQFISAIVLPLVWLSLSQLAGLPAWFALITTLASIALGWFIPMLIVNSRIRKRKDAIEKGLPDLIDLIVVTLEAGLSFPQSLRLASTKVKEPLAGEVRLTLQEQNMGLTLVEALENFLQRIDTVGVRMFARSIAQGETLGVSTGQIMRNLAIELRKRRRAYAEERAQKAPVKVLFPMLFLIMPALFVVLLVPVMIRIMEVF